MNALGRKLTSLFASRRFFYVIMGFFIFEAVWFAVSIAYPMAFDEDFHMGVIKVYAEQWSPFLAGQPPGADAFGAVARDPSYLFHYLMSFPYRLVAAFTDNMAAQVIILRLINVGIFAWGLILFRKVLRKAGASAALTNVAFAVFILIPIVPQLAAHVNYDNLLMPLLAWACLLVFRLVDSFREQRIDMSAVLQLVTVCLITSVVKYAALPLLAAIVLFVGIMAYRTFKGKGKRFRKRIIDGYLRLGRTSKIVLIAAVAVSGILFAQRYVVNAITYSHPVPDCGKVLSVEQCMQYGPWGRDYTYEQNRPADFEANPFTFMGSWLGGMRHRLFFAVSGAQTYFVNYIELPVPVRLFTVLFFAGIIAMIVWWRPLFQGHAYMAFFLLLSLLYCAILWYDQYGMYKQTGIAVAINGRYLLPILLPMFVVVGRAFAIGLSRFRRENLKPYLASLAVVLMLQGGGMLTFLLRADQSWYWNNSALRSVNDTARDVVAPFIIEGDKYADWHKLIF
jgi:hypothetical protein